jgi:signal transduction histidine kinase
MNVKYETAQKELVIEHQQTEMKQQRTRTLMFAGGFIAVGLLSILLVFLVVLRNKRNTELAETNVTKDKFFSIISQDLKNPAVSQRDALQILFENFGKWDEDTLNNYIQELVKSANGQVDLIYTLLNWAHIQTGRMTYQPSLFDLSTIIQSGVGLIKDMANNKGVIMNVQIPDAAVITADKNMLNTVFRNLLTNAVKFTATGGTVTLNINENKGKYTVSVSDTGVGMTPEQVNNLCRIEIKQSRPGTAGEQGTGLGRIVCKDMLEKHGSKLQVESEEGKGSRFWFEVKK